MQNANFKQDCWNPVTSTYLLVACFDLKIEQTQTILIHIESVERHKYPCAILTGDNINT